ncbi:MAG: sel1 repeat family protein, partial [Alphaproteobacteria bacterium]
AETATVAPAPDPGPEEGGASATPDRDVADCRALAGEASAGVPPNAEAAREHRTALAAAAGACTRAAGADDAPPDLLFLAAEIAQGRRDTARAFALLQRAAKAGFGPAETRLGDYYLFGAAPGGKNIEAAVEHYEKATLLHDAPGMTTLALMHRAATGVPKDPARMVALLGWAADAGYHFAQYRLAQTYLNGEGIPGRSDESLGIPDPARAAKLYTKAAEAGNMQAALELAALYADPNSPLGENPEERARLVRMAANAGLPEAKAALAALYETGQGVEKDPALAAQLYVEALESGKLAFDELRRAAPARWDEATAIEFQRLLADRGLYDGALDGVVGPNTRAAARALSGR